MVSQLELHSRARLCRQLAKREPANRTLWMAEAGNWSRLSKERLRGEEWPQIDSGMLASLRALSARLLLRSDADKELHARKFAETRTLAASVNQLTIHGRCKTGSPKDRDPNWSGDGQAGGLDTDQQFTCRAPASMENVKADTDRSLP